MRWLTYHRKIFMLLALVAAGPFSQARDSLNVYPDTLRKNRLNGVMTVTAAGYAGSIAGLYYLWYKDYPQSSFHFFNDCREWKGVDKAGHAATAYWLGRIGYHSLRWSGVEERRSIWTGGNLGLLYLTTVEIFDGFSDGWGASACDVAANITGTGLFIGQQLAWHDQKMMIKFSYSSTFYPEYRPDLLGKSAVQRLMKDYNGHTYWLSANLHSILNNAFMKVPWLNIAIGYGADGMLGAFANPSEHQGTELPQVNRASQFYLSLDADLTRIRTRSDTLKFLLNLVGFIKIPFPALEYHTAEGIQFHWIFF